jgi:sugar fermentation stimulation protein A
MQYTTPLIPAKFIKREKRFFAYCELPDGTPVTAHCANTGSLRGVLDYPIKQVWLSKADDPARKLQYSLEVAEMASGAMVGIHTGRTNNLAAEYLKMAYPDHMIKPEAKWDAHTRFDFLMTDPAGHKTWVEVKTVTCVAETGEAMFPDAVSTRGLKHLQTLIEAVEKGESALQLYLVLRNDCPHFRAALEIDPDYAASLEAAHQAGVEVRAMQCLASPSGLLVEKPLEIRFGQQT